MTNKLTLAATAIGTVKAPRQRNIGKSVRSGFEDRHPPMKDSNPWRTLLQKRRGYNFAVKVLSRCLSLFRKKDSKDLFSENACRAAETCRGCPAYTIREEQGIIFLQGKKLDPGTDATHYMAKQDQQVILKSQVSSFFVFPSCRPKTALRRSVCESVHDSFHGDSVSSAQARSSCY